MTTPVLPQLVRSTVARMPVRGVPSILRGISRLVLGDAPRMMRIARGFDLHVDPRDPAECMMYYGLHGGGALHFAERILQHGDTAFDIGGHVGFFAGAFAQMVGAIGQVAVFEPDPRLWERLIEGIRRNDHLPITPRDAAVTGRTGEATLHLSPDWGGSSLVDPGQAGHDTVTVRTTRLDDLLGDRELGWDRMRLIKLDVRGGEAQALAGMRLALDRYRPHLICALDAACLERAGDSPEELIGALEDAGYTIQAIVEPRGLLRTTVPRLVDVAGEGDVPWRAGDLLCTPRDEQ